MGDATLYTVLPTHTAQAGIALGGVGILLSANRLIRVPLNGPAGLVYDRLPRRGLFIASLFIGALSTALYAATRGFWPLLAGRLLWGLAWSGIWVGGATMILDVAADRERGRWTGLYQTWFFLGSAAGALAGGVFTDWLGYAMTMWLGAGVTAFGGLVALLLLPETRPASPAGAARGLALPSLLRLGKGVWLAAFLHGINRFVIAGVLSATLALLVQRNLVTLPLPVGVASLTGILMAGRTLFSTFSAPLAGGLSDRFGDRWKVTLAGLLAGAVSMGLLGRSDPFSILSGILLGALASGGLQTLVTAIIGDQVSLPQRGQAIGLLHTAGDLGSALGPPVAYAMLPVTGLPPIYGLCAGLFVVGLLVTLALFPLRRGNSF